MVIVFGLRAVGSELGVLGAPVSSSIASRENVWAVAGAPKKNMASIKGVMLTLANKVGTAPLGVNVWLNLPRKSQRVGEDDSDRRIGLQRRKTDSTGYPDVGPVWSCHAVWGLSIGAAV